MYLTAYLLTVDQMFTPIEGSPCAPCYQLFGHSLDRNVAPTIFSPIQRLDVRVRPRTWVFHRREFDRRSRNGAANKARQPAPVERQVACLAPAAGAAALYVTLKHAREIRHHHRE